MANRQAQPSEWKGITTFPAPTQQSLSMILNALKANNYREATVLVLGKGGMGKSSTVNTLLGERVCNVTAFQADRDAPVEIARSSAGFVLRVIDTPGLVDSGSVSELNLQRIAAFCVGRKINAVLYVDRLDAYRVDGLDRQIVKAISNSFGSKIWDITSVVLTRSNMPSPPDGRSFAEFVIDRSQQMQNLIKKEGHEWWKFGTGHKPSVLFVENLNAEVNEGGEKILPNGEVFLVSAYRGLLKLIVDSKSGVRIDRQFTEGSKGKLKEKLLIPLFILAEYYFVFKPIWRHIRRDFFRTRGLQYPWESQSEAEMRDGRQRDSLGRIEECREYHNKTAAGKK